MYHIEHIHFLYELSVSIFHTLCFKQSFFNNIAIYLGFFIVTNYSVIKMSSFTLLIQKNPKKFLSSSLSEIYMCTYIYM